MRSLTKVTSVFLAIFIFSSIFLEYWGYSTMQKLHPESWLDVVAGQAQAPVQYRIGVILPAYAVTRHSHLAFRHVFTMVDLISAFVAVFSLLFVLRSLAVYRRASLPTQWFANAGFVVLVQFYLMWLAWYQRPETLITAAILALSLLLLTVRPPISGAAGYAVTAAGLLALSLAQGFIRADVAFSLHVGVFLVCLINPKAGDDFALPRWLQAGTSLMAAGVCGGLQFYLMHVVYPAATYVDGPMFQLLINLKSPTEWVPFFLFLTPLLWTVTTLRRYRGPIEGPGAGFLAGAIIFLGLWLVAGRIEEVRIFMPFALGLAPFTVGLAVERYGMALTERLPAEIAS